MTSAPAKEAARVPGPGVDPQPSVNKPGGPTSTQAGPQAAFTEVQKGETLRDVAKRVYGSTDALDSLWRANRDVLPHIDSPLSSGSVLRTPAEGKGS
jgi:nucleoid-associated protein YgaU